MISCEQLLCIHSNFIKSSLMDVLDDDNEDRKICTVEQFDARELFPCKLLSPCHQSAFRPRVLGVEKHTIGSRVMRPSTCGVTEPFVTAVGIHGIAKHCVAWFPPPPCSYPNVHPWLVFHSVKTISSPRASFLSKPNLRSKCTQRLCWNWSRHQSCWNHKNVTPPVH